MLDHLQRVERILESPCSRRWDEAFAKKMGCNCAGALSFIPTEHGSRPRRSRGSDGHITLKSMHFKILVGALLLVMPGVCGRGSVLDFGSDIRLVSPEGIAISNQFRARFGMSFRRADGGYPNIGRRGVPRASFLVPLDSRYVPPPIPQPMIAARTYASLAITGVAGQLYRVEYAERMSGGPTMQPSNWVVLPGVFPPTSPFLWVDYSSANACER